MATAAMANGTAPSITSPNRTQPLQPPESESPRAPAPSSPNILTDTELAAAQNLVHLSESSSSSNGSSTEDLNLQGSACSSSSSSPISVNTRHPSTTPAEEGTMDWEEQICPRRQQRYRSIPSLYEVTDRVDGIGRQRERSTRSDRNKRNRR